MMIQNELTYIQMVYQKGSFSKAAQALCLTQPALSIAIHKIEDEIGMPLFDRNQKPLGLTEAGHLYISKIKQMQILEDELKSQLLDLSSMNRGSIKIGATSYIISCILPPVLMRFKQQYPSIQLNIIEAGSYELREMLQEQKLDMTFVSQLEKDSHFSRHPGFQDHLILSVPVSFQINEALKDFALSGRDIRSGRHLDVSFPSVDLKVFKKTPFILLEDKYNLRVRANAFFEEAGIQPNICMEAAQILTTYALARAGIGAVFLPDRAVGGDSSETVFYKLASSQTARDMSIATNSKSYISCATQRFIEEFSAYYSN